MVHVTQWLDGFVAKHTLFAVVPFRDNVPDQTILWIRLNLSQAFLAAILPFRPARTLTEPKCRLVEEHAECGLARRQINGSCLLRFRTGHQPFPTNVEIGPHAGSRPQDEQSCA